MKKISFTGLLALTPFLALAQTGQDVLRTIGDLISLATPVVVALALLYFFWGLASFILAAGGDDEKKQKGRSTMIWGIIALFIIVSIWGLIGVVQNTFDLDTGSTIDVPFVDTDPFNF